MTELPPIAVLLLAAAAWLALATICYAYFGYPLLVRLIPRRRELTTAAGPREGWPRVSVLVAAFDEEEMIERRVRNLLDQEYPGEFEVLVVSDASTDGTDAALASIDDPRLRWWRQSVRQGKTAGINRIAAEARGEILVQTDANVLFAPGAITALVRAFADPEVAVAVGEVSFTNDEDPLVAGGEGLYWRFESWVKHCESERDLLCVAHGGIYALRRSCWRPLPHRLAGDAVEPLLAAQQGMRTVIVPDARGIERAAASRREEFRRKARIIAQQVACARWIELRRLPGRILFAYVSHKLLRYTVPVAGAAGLVAGGLALLGGSLIALPATLALLAPLVALPAELLPLAGRLGRLARIPGYLLLVNLASLKGLRDGLAGNAPAVWEVPRSTRTDVNSA